MKFKSQLREGILLKRYFGFLLQVSLQDKQKLTIKCPTIDVLPNCDTLGSRIWFSNPMPLTVEYLHTWELVEIENSVLVCINPQHAINLALEGIKKNIITELQYSDNLRSQISYGKGERIDILLTKGFEQTYVIVQPITWVDVHGMGYFPNISHYGLDYLHKLIKLKQAGHRAVLLYCGQHNNIKCIRPMLNAEPVLQHIMREAINIGVEIIAYRTHVTLSGMVLESPIPVLFNESLIMP